MRVLAFDTTCAACSVAVWKDETVESVVVKQTMHGHAETLMPAIERALAEANTSYDAIDRIAVTVGPGSFTGVRVGLATARGLGVATGKPVLGLMTSAVLAQEAKTIGTSRRIAVAIDARRAELYMHHFTADGTARDEPHSLPAKDAARALGAALVIVVGDGAELLRPHLGQNALISGPTVPDAGVAAAMAAVLPEPHTPPQPVYVRPPDAVVPLSGGRLRP